MNINNKLCIDCEHNESEKITVECLECVDKSSWRGKMIDKKCITCGRGYRSCSNVFCKQGFTAWIPMPESISLPFLNNLTPTVQGCTNKLIEELGELLTLIGKGHQQSGESDKTVEQITEDIEMNMVREAFDVAQSAVTMAHTLCSKHGIDMEMMLRDHKNKLRERGYLK